MTQRRFAAMHAKWWENEQSSCASAGWESSTTNVSIPWLREVQCMRACRDTSRSTGLSSSTEDAFGFSTCLFQLSQLSGQSFLFSLSPLYPMGTLSKLSFSTGVFSRDPPQPIQLCYPCSVAKAVIKTYFSLTLQGKTILALRNFCSH